MHLFAMGLAAGSLGILRLSADPGVVFQALVPLGIAGFVVVAASVTSRLWARSTILSVTTPTVPAHPSRPAPWRVPRIVSLCLAASSGLLLGSFWTLLACQTIAARVIDEALVGQDLIVEGRVIGIPRRDGRHVSLDFLILESSERAEGMPRRVRLSWNGGNSSVRAGEHWRLTVRLRPVSGFRNTGGFDRVRYLIERRIDATGQVRASPMPLRLAAGTGIDSWRQSLADRVEALQIDTGTAAGTTAEVNVKARPGNTPAVDRSNPSVRAIALVQALTLGISHRVDDVTWSILRDSGTAHLLAISGLHVTLIAGWGLWLARGLARRCGATAGRAHYLALLASLLLAIAYAVLAGFGLPVRRAVVMLVVWIGASARLRVLPSNRALSIALVAVLLVDPLAPLSVGFWLSFGTVALLSALHAGRIRSPNAPLHRRIAAALRTHCLLGIVLLPVTAWFFQSGAVIAPLANAIAVPLVGLFVVPLAFAVLALSSVWPDAATVALRVFDAASGWILAVLEWLIATSSGSWTLSLPSVEILLWCLAGMLVLCAGGGRLPRLLVIALLIPAGQANLRPSSPPGFELHVLDVGQGLAALVLTRNRTWLYDTGDRLSPSLSMLEAVVVPYLHSLGRRDVDVIVISHPDRDHAAGIDDAIARWPDARVIVGVPDPSLPADAARCRAGDTELHDDVRFSFLHPYDGDTGSENDRSCVLLIHQGDSRVLLTGDIEASAERRLVDRMGELRVSVLTAPHHGSKTSSSDTFVRAFSPEHVVYPAGYRNRHGFPHPSVQMRYNTAGASAHLTSRGGAVRFLFGLSGLVERPVAWHDARHRFWHDMVEPL